MFSERFEVSARMVWHGYHGDRSYKGLPAYGDQHGTQPPGTKAYQGMYVHSGTLRHQGIPVYVHSGTRDQPVPEYTFKA